MSGPINTLNPEPLRDTLAHITANPVEYNQHTFGSRTACGTTACIAGHLILRSPDWEPVWDSYSGIRTVHILSCACRADGTFMENPANVAMRILGVDPLYDHGPAYRILEEMFHEDTTLARIHELAAQFYALAGDRADLAAVAR